jgi:hypothetical protein
MESRQPSAAKGTGGKTDTRRRTEAVGSVLTFTGGEGGAWTGRRDGSSGAATEAASRLGWHCRDSSCVPAQPLAFLCAFHFPFSRAHLEMPLPATSAPTPVATPKSHARTPPTHLHIPPPLQSRTPPQRFQERVRCLQYLLSRALFSPSLKWLCR